MAQSRTKGEQFQRRTLQALAKEARRRARPLIPSRTLRRSMQIFIDRNTTVYLQIPYFWALYVHDGRGPYSVHSRARKGRRQPRYLVWFKNPRDDPRTQGASKYPKREKEIRQLTLAQWEYGLERNKERSPGNPYMIVVRSVNKTTPANPFFEKGLAGFDAHAAPIVKAEFEKFLLSQLIGDEDTVSLRL